MRSGPVSTAMTFEEGKRHFCVYDTPFSSFQVCVRALTVKNALLTDGELILVGNPALLEQFGIDSPDAARVAGELADGGTTPMIVAAGGRALGVIAVAGVMAALLPWIRRRIDGGERR